MILQNVFSVWLNYYLSDDSSLPLIIYHWNNLIRKQLSTISHSLISEHKLPSQRERKKNCNTNKQPHTQTKLLLLLFFFQALTGLSIFRHVKLHCVTQSLICEQNHYSPWIKFAEEFAFRLKSFDNILRIKCLLKTRLYQRAVRFERRNLYRKRHSCGAYVGKNKRLIANEDALCV